MTDRPIPFSPLMVRAILREIAKPGTGKTQTRRHLTGACDDPPAFIADGVVTALDANDRGYRWPRTHGVGDRLWVKEAWRTGRAYDDLSPSEMSGEEPIQYEAGPIRLPLQDGRYRHARFMPRWASRITLLVTDVRVERLQNISEDDAEAEGWPAPQDRAKTGIAEIRDAYPIGWYAALWESLHGPGSWEANPFVAVYGFRPVLANIDNMEAAHG
ncbi:hypothetical protein IMF23_00155 [Chelatococcus daeguensis]|uniref:hypothetical protein n=1 Tax=Chelatococcus daeguensis TaxID=444444 RepID=UPI0007ABCF52|nr:hypothetical protein [Chelatococcus daeguensis]KZE34124.1 hypothetical protein AVW15_17570 [Chelatococcus daeguensis]MBM3081841.1 hypothetical protein [Chelatococcus daeguensis]